MKPLLPAVIKGEAMYILGLSALTHDSAAALLSERGIEAAIEESKLARQRNTGGVPYEAIRFCLDKARINWENVDYIAVASRPLRAWARQAWLRTKLASRAPIASTYYQTKALGELARELNNHRILRVISGHPARRVLALEHHLCHAASAFYASPFDRALILTMDEHGDGWSGLVALGEGTQIRRHSSLSFPHSLAWVYSQITQLLGFAPHHEEHKTQWLSLEGEPVFADVFLEMLRRSPNLPPHLNFSFFIRGLAGEITFSKQFFARLGIPPGRPPDLNEAIRRQLASSLQYACTLVVAEWLESLRRKTGARHLCLGGGLFLNVLLVAALEKNTGFDKIFVQPAAGNPGCAPGAAWFFWHQVLRKPRFEPMSNLYWGPSYASEEIKRVLDSCKARYHWCDTEERKMEETIRLVEAGKIVAWYQGATEFGPRALGNRSLLASPWAPYVKENLNEYVKHREPFRPFAVAVPEEDYAKYFDCSQLGRFMSTLGWARPACEGLLEGFLLSGKRLRLHLVERQTNPLFWQLLKRFGEHARAPFLINSSFNLFGEPLVTRPREAVQTFFCSGIDALVIDGFILEKA